MKRFACLMVLAALTTPAHAGSYSFVIGGHHIHLEASRHCRSLSCVSWSEINKKRDRDDMDAVNTGPALAQTPAAPVAAPAAVVPAPAPAPVAVQPAAAVPQPQIAVAPVQTQAAPAPVQQAAATAPAVKPVEARAMTVTPAVTPPAPPPAPQAAPVKADTKADTRADAKVEVKEEAKPRVGFDLKPDAKLEPKLEPKIESKIEIKPVEPKVEAKIEVKTEAKTDPKPDTKSDTTASVSKTPVDKPQADKPAVVAKPAPSKSTLQSEGDGVEVPIGDWQTEGRKGLVRIEPCGTALCGYMINNSSNAKGETVLINMKPRTRSDRANPEWSGSIYSRASGNTYYATMTVKRPNTLRVEACIVGRYFCSGNNWTRIAPKPDDIVSPRETREASAEPVR